MGSPNTYPLNIDSIRAGGSHYPAFEQPARPEDLNVLSPVSALDFLTNSLTKAAYINPELLISPPTKTPSRTL